MLKMSYFLGRVVKHYVICPQTLASGCWVLPPGLPCYSSMLLQPFQGLTFNWAGNRVATLG